MKNIVIGSIVALGLASTSAYAQSTVGGGAAASGPQGSVAGGASAGTADSHKDRQQHRRHGTRRDEAAPSTPGTANSATTYGAGSIYTDRNGATGGVTAGGTASGTGSQSTSSSVDAYGSTDRSGSTGEVYGDSSATSTNPKP